MQRNRRWLIWLLIPLGAVGTVGAWATGYIAVPWQLPAVQQSASTDARDTNKSQRQAATERKSPAIAQTPSNTVVASTPGRSTENATTAPPTTSKGEARKFGIDIARISAEGGSVIAGFAKPLEQLTVMADGVPVGTTVADAAGDWVLITPHKFANLDPKLEIREGDLTAPKLASLRNAQPSSSTGRTSETGTTGSHRQSAAAVTRQMMRRLEKLTTAATNTTAPPANTQATAEPTKPQRVAALASPSPPTSQRAGAASDANTAPNGPSAATSKTQVESAALREVLPVPVQFVYREASFTDQGREAAALLLRYFKAKNYSRIALSGHADERGSATANLDLSRRRLNRLKQFLRDGGYTGELKLVPRGATEKFRGVDRAQFPLEELYQLDRRVEVIAAE